MAGAKEPFWTREFLFSFEGRITRYDFWVRYMVPYFAVYFALIYVEITAGWMYQYGTLGGEPLETGIPSTIFWVLTLYPSVAICAKRFHDCDYSGWVQAVPYGLLLLTTVGGYVSPVLSMIAVVPMIISLIWFMVVTGFLRGTRGKNKYGADPLEDLKELDDLPPPSADA